MSLLILVERHLRRAAVAPSRFGREVAGDPRFVFDLRRGREPRPATIARVRAFISMAERTSSDSAASATVNIGRS
jgi:hypothetical protein